MRAADEKRAEQLRSRGWVVIPPGDVQLTAVIRPYLAYRDAPDVKSRVAVYGPPAAGGRPRADLDGLGDREIAAFYTTTPLPVATPATPYAGDRMSAFREELAGQGYDLVGAWTFGTDAHGRFASVRVRHADGITHRP